MYYLISINLDRFYFDCSLIANDDKNNLYYYSDIYKVKGVKSIKLTNKSNDGKVEFILQSQEYLEDDFIENSMNEFLRSYQNKYAQKKNVRNQLIIRNISIRPIRKKIASNLIKNYYIKEKKKVFKCLSEYHRGYALHFLSIIKHTTNDNILEINPLLSTWIKNHKGDYNYLNAIYFILRSNYFLKNRIVDENTESFSTIHEMLTNDLYIGKIFIVGNIDMYSKLRDFLKNYKYNNLLGHAFIIRSNTTKFTNIDFRLEIESKDKTLPQIIEKTIIDDTLKSLDNLIGLDKVKGKVKEILIMNYVNIKHHNENLKMSNHFSFLGNPGSGKTTVARMMAEFFYNAKINKTNKLIEVDRSDLVGEYIGHTAQMTSKVLRKANGGVLFVDEAYSLYGEGKDYGIEAINTINKYIEDKREDFVSIFAGYQEPMEKMFSMNPGFKGRINHHIIFEDYTPDELCEIFSHLAKSECFEFESKLIEKLYYYFLNNKIENGRGVRNIYEGIKRSYALRLFNTNNLDIKLLKACDFKPLEYSNTSRKHAIGF